ncbi:mevalonate kinase-like isoform X1 [Leptidea sinapis]|uniref:mevalonate kinase-like isoform X1 n=1 Tax=Leptidea sinapis TaxID=189913 RepID=UPI0021468C65|nr:mevalonate kinase-like isoform X1 [Leptidea sinapis]
MEGCVVKVSAPGKVILHGEHSVVYGKTAIAVSLGLRTSVSITERTGTDFIINLPSVKLKQKIALATLIDGLLNQTGTQNPDSVVHEIHLQKIDEFINKFLGNISGDQRNAIRGFLYLTSGILGGSNSGLLDQGLEVVLVSELTIGAGTGSSASFAACLAGGMIQFARVKKSCGAKEFDESDRRLISKWAFNCEKIMHGSPSGIDNTTCTFGSLVAFRKGIEPQILDLRLNLRILLVDTRVSRQTRALTARVVALRESNPRAVDCIMEAIDHVTISAKQILENLGCSGPNGDTSSEYQRLEELWNMNHCLLASLGVSHPTLESIRASACAHGLACKLTGAGGGGYAIVLVPPSTAQSAVDALTTELTSKGFAVKDTQLGGPGVILH